jgi:hypothetical protein
MFPGPLNDAQLPDTGSAAIREANDNKTKRVARSAVVMSFIERKLLLAFQACTDLLDVVSIKRLTVFEFHYLETTQ